MNLNDPLLNAVAAGGESEVRRLLAESKPRSASDLRDLLHRAVKVSLGMTRTLVEAGADVNACDHVGIWSAHVAASSGALDSLAYLASVGARLDRRGPSGYTLLHVAAAHGSTRVVNWLLEQGGLPDAREESNATPLAVAARCLQPHVIPLLRPRDTNGEDRSGEFGSTPFHLVAHWADRHSRSSQYANNIKSCERAVRCLRALHELGHDVNARDWRGRAPLHIVRNADASVLETLIAMGADVEACDIYGDTPLLTFVRPGPNHGDSTTESAELLVAAGARVDRANDRGETPLQFIKSRRLRTLKTLGQAALAKRAAEATLSRASAGTNAGKGPDA